MGYIGNFDFTNKEDAEKFAEENGGVIHDNTHSANEWADNQYTVHAE